MKRSLVLAVALLVFAGSCAAAPPGTLPDWGLGSADARATAGQRFEIVVVSLTGEPLPDQLSVRIKGDIDERTLNMKAEGPALGRQRAYAATMPANFAGTVELELVGLNSS